MIKSKSCLSGDVPFVQRRQIKPAQVVASFAIMFFLSKPDRLS